MYFKCITSLSIFGLLSAARDSRPEERIIGGHAILIEYVPWQVSLLKNMFHICGGAIQSDRVILTAAHCVVGKKLEDLSIRAGSSVLKKGGQVVKVLKAIPHAKYVFETVPFDIAVLILESPLKFNSRVQKIDIADETPPVGNMTLVTGWGCTNFDANFSWPILQRGPCASR
ncbi:trypsin delta-like [Drosophila ficusphila]|uniref:trypsin delta-like n=1 Tax=Drosophila ficusphila TaxID=30025 RepID=UPI001C8A5620|nr:trypsin delta-like [Drosophila ficusphila]